MKILFSGPSLRAEDRQAFPDLDHRPPARRGDIVRAVRDGATAIGLVDGLFGGVPAVWHKEILSALAAGVAVAGGASMGALRAAECAAFGMVGIGVVYSAVARGRVVHDAWVAQAHGPSDIGWLPVSEAEADLAATVALARRRGAIEPAEARALATAGAAAFFADRTLKRVVADAALPEERRSVVLGALSANRLERKRRDGLKVARWVRARPDVRGTSPEDWTLAETSQWRAMLAEETP